MTDRFLRACRREPVDRTPLWIMRQAGRYLPEYRELRSRYDFLTVCRTPELAAEVTLQPLRRFPLDAAILFSDILVPVEALGVAMTFAPGPTLAEPLRTRAQIDALALKPAAEVVPYVADAVRLLRRELDGRTPLIGFCGAPWTLAAYLIEGRGKEGFAAAKTMLYREPAALGALLEKLAAGMADYLALQIRAGAQAVQIFDSWAGLLGPAEFRQFSLPFVRHIVNEVRPLGVPVIYFVNASPHLLEIAAESGADVLGLCWRTPLDEAARRLGPDVALQGNLDPHVLFASPEVVRREALDVLNRVAGRPGHIMNLGHGILPTTPIASVEALVEAMKGPRESFQGKRETPVSLCDEHHKGKPEFPFFPETTPEVLSRYDRPGPRYTSYPTAVEFHEGVDAGVYAEKLARADAASAEPLSLYAHLPFCEERCSYCGCHVIITKHRHVESKYLDYLDREIDLLASHLPHRRQLSQMHWGGGTPTYHPPEHLARIHARIARHFSFTPDAEIGIEIDPRVTSGEQLETLRGLGFNRLSLGVQDFNPQVQEAVNRVQSYDLTRDVIERGRALGFGSVNVDLIYGLPYQTIEGFRDTLDQVLTLRPDRVAVYSFAFVPWIRAHMKHLPESALPAPDVKLSLLAAAIDAFGGAGYRQIGMDHFALPDDELARAIDRGTLHRNFMGYTVQSARDMVGIGVSAIGDVQGAFVQNTKKLSDYYAALDAGRLPVERGYALDEDDLIRRHVITELMCNGRLDTRAVARRFEIDFDDYFADELAELTEDLTKVMPGAIDLTPTGRLFVRNVCMTFDRYLRARTADAQPVFSRTV